MGDYPMQGIEWLVDQLGNLIRNNMAEGPLKDLLIDGIIGGVGGVIVFLPNILILYFLFLYWKIRGIWHAPHLSWINNAPDGTAWQVLYPTDYGIRL